MRFVKCLALAIFVSFICLINQGYAKRLSVEEVDSREYLLNHGHSPEVYRLIELQNARILGKKINSEGEEIKSNNKLVKFLKNLYYERDFTLPLYNFGQHPIETPEAPPPGSIPQRIQDSDLL